MSEYEFWDELGNIFNAIVAYQHKTIEFNKRYVNPWLRLGSVLDQNDHNSDALLAARKAIEIDQENGSNWLSLGDVFFKMGSFDDAANAYAKAVELNPNLGWAYANLAMTNVTRKRYNEAVNLYVKSLELIEGDKDRAMIWNRLGNVYRKVNDYENAFIAFQMADECDGQNTGFQDQLDEVTVEQRVMPIIAEVYVNNNTRTAAETQNPAVEEVSALLETTPAEETVSETVTEAAEQESVPTVEHEVITDIADAPLGVEVESVTDVGDLAAEETMVQEAAEAEAPKMNDEVAATTDQAEQLTSEIVLEEPAEEMPVTEFEESIEQASDTVAVEDALGMEAAAHEVETAAEDVAVEAAAEVSMDAIVAENEQSPVAVELSVEQSMDEAVQTELTSEIPVENVVSDESASESMAEAPVEEPQSESLQTVSVAEEITLEALTGMPEAGETCEIEDASLVEDHIDTSQISTDVPVVESVKENASTETTVAFMMSQTVETFADPTALNQPVVLVIEDLGELIRQTAAEENEAAEDQVLETDARLEVQAEADVESDIPAMDAEMPSATLAADDEVSEVVAEIVALANTTDEAPLAEAGIQREAPVDVEEPAIAVMDREPDLEIVEVAVTDAVQSEHEAPLVEPAYEEFLKDATEPVAAPVNEVEVEENNPVSKGELKVEPDTKNAHVWNELGNVYFNTGAFEEAIAAYSKAIELDDWFAWPYSNLALVYVQKEKYAEAILLYQRSIELFSSDKDKAITWNRLGNVYRRLNDYDNAIACYQRADELDPNNATRSLRSRFSLLGSLNIEQSPSLAV